VAVFRSSEVSCIAFAACMSMGSSQATAQRFKGPTYSLAAPAGWVTTTQNIAKGGVAFVGPLEGDFAVNINLLSEPAPHETLAQYVEANRRQIAAHKELGMTILKDSKTVLGGTPAHTTFAEMHVPKRPEMPHLRTYQVYAMHQDRAYILTLTYPKKVTEAAIKKYRAAFDQVAASFRWEKLPAPKK
jgi:hypothetical protein